MGGKSIWAVSFFVAIACRNKSNLSYMDFPKYHSYVIFEVFIMYMWYELYEFMKKEKGKYVKVITFIYSFMIVKKRIDSFSHKNQLRKYLNYAYSS